jgi:hypothetical protein
LIIKSFSYNKFLFLFKFIYAQLALLNFIKLNIFLLSNGLIKCIIFNFPLFIELDIFFEKDFNFYQAIKFVSIFLFLKFTKSIIRYLNF